MKYKIANRKTREKEYSAKYGDRSNDVYDRLKNFLGDKFTIDLIKKAKFRIEEAHNKIQYSKIQFTFYEEPMQSHRPRVNFFTHRLYVPNASSNYEFLKHFLDSVNATIKVISMPIAVELKAYYSMPANIKPEEVLLYELEHDYAFTKPDFDNVLKAYTDMIQKIIIADDDLICRSVFEKYYSLKPRVELSIIYTNGVAMENTYKKIISRKSFKELENLVDVKLLVTPMAKLKKGVNYE